MQKGPKLTIPTFKNDIWEIQPNLSFDMWFMSSQRSSMLNKRPLGLRAPLSNNIWSLIKSPIKLNEHPMTLIWPFNATKVKFHEVNWNTIYDSLRRRFIQNFIRCSVYETQPFESHVTFIWPRKAIIGQMSWGKLIVRRWLHICVHNKLWPEHD